MGDGIDYKSAGRAAGIPQHLLCVHPRKRAPQLIRSPIRSVGRLQGGDVPASCLCPPDEKAAVEEGRLASAGVAVSSAWCVIGCMRTRCLLYSFPMLLKPKADALEIKGGLPPQLHASTRHPTWYNSQRQHRIPPSDTTPSANTGSPRLIRLTAPTSDPPVWYNSDSHPSPATCCSMKGTSYALAAARMGPATPSLQLAWFIGHQSWLWFLSGHE